MKFKPTHQGINSPNIDVIAHQFERMGPLPAWCRNFARKDINHWMMIARDGKTKVIAKEGDWAVMDENSMVVLTDEEFRRLFRSIVV